MNKETLRMQMLAGVITESQYKTKLKKFTILENRFNSAVSRLMLNENYNLQPIKSILLSDATPEEKMEEIGNFLTDTEEGEELSNTNLGNPVDGWFSTKRNANKWLTQIQLLVNNPEEIKDISDDLI